MVHLNMQIYPAAIVDNADGTYSFDPSVAGVGTHEITYRTPDVILPLGDAFIGEEDSWQEAQ